MQYHNDDENDDDILEIEQYKKRKPNVPSSPKAPAPNPIAMPRVPKPVEAEPRPQPRRVDQINAAPDDQLTRPSRPILRPSRMEPPPDQPMVMPPIIPNPIPPTTAPPAYIPPPTGYPRKSKSSLKPLMLAVVALSLTLLVGTMVVITLRLMNGRNAPLEGQAERGTRTVDLAFSNATAVPTEIIPPTATVGVQIEPWNGRERFTVLLLGLDKRPNETGNAFRTDSMILVSLDPATRSVGILSVPRDLYVEIPRDTIVGASYGLQRINTAYYIGERVQEGYGPKLAMQAVQYNLGVRIHDYLVYDFEAVIAAIDAVGGIDIDVPRTIVDPEYPAMIGFAYDPLYIRAGLQHMNGTLALKYARTRHDSSDLDRAKRQQQIMITVRDKILNLNMIPELVVRAPTLWSQLSRHIKSGLTFDQLLRLALYVKDIPISSIRTGVIDYGYVQPIRWNGADVLVPNRQSIGPLLVQVFGPNYNQ